MAALGRSLPKLISSSPSTPIFTLSRGVATKLFIGGLSVFITENRLYDVFSEHGQVIEAKVVKDRATNKPKGFGFVTYAFEDEAKTAKREMNGKELARRVIFVEFAKPLTSSSRGPPESENASSPVLASMKQETS